MAVETHINLDEVVCHFAELEDPRSEVNRRHPLASVLVIALLAVLAGAAGPTAIARWAMFKRDLLIGILPLPNGIPCKDVFRRVLATLQPAAFQVCFVNWLQSLRQSAADATGIDQPIVAIDGKTLRRSHDAAKGLGALHSVSAWLSDFGLSLGQVATEEKSNEITAIPEILRLVDIRGAIVTIDAIGTQTKIAKQIVDGEGDYVLPVKGNQGKLQQAVEEYVNQQMDNDFEGIGARKFVTKEDGHGRKETRHYIQMPAPKTLPGFSKWTKLTTLGVVLLHCIRNGKESIDARYFISSLPLGVKTFARAVRGHWAIENTCHWSLDVTYREDESRIREKNLRQNFAWLNRFTLSLLKQHPGKQSIAMKRRSCGWSEEFLIETIAPARV